jgi:hypothetical protein
VHVAILLIGHYTYFGEPDNTTQFWAWYQKEAAVLHSGALTLWDANTLAGHSFVGETQTGVFYPVNIVWLLLFGSSHGISARRLDMLVVFHLLLASVGFYALARSFRCSRLTAVVGGVVFAYTGVVFARTTAQTAIFFGLAWVPWAVWFGHRQLQTGRLRWAAGAGAAAGLGVLAGHFQPPFHAALLVLLLYMLTRPGTMSSWRAEFPRRLAAAATTAGVGALVALPQLVYSLPYLNRAYRFVGPGPPIPPGGEVSYHTFSHLYSGGPESIFSLLDPQRYPVADGNELFIGLAALVVLLTTAVAVRRSIRAQIGRYDLPLLAAGAIGILAMLGPWTFFPRVLYALPFVTEVRELGRYSIMVQLVLCLLLVFTLQAIGEGGLEGAPARRKRRELLAWIAGVCVALDGLYLLLEHAPGSDGWFGVQLALGGGALLALATIRRPPRLAAVLGALIVLSALHNAGRELSRTSSPLYPPHYYARSQVIAYVEHACANHRTYVLGNALPSNVSDVYRDIRITAGYGATMHVPFYDFITETSWNGAEQTQLLDERCIAAAGSLAVPGYHLGFRDPATGVSVYVDPETSPLNTIAFRPLPVRILHDSDRHLAYAVSLQRTATVVVSAIVYPGWQMRVDGRRVETASFRLRGVPIFPEVTLGPGSHTLDYSWSGWPA